MLVSKYLSSSECSCRCGCAGLPQKKMMDKFDAIREAFGSPINVTSGFRCAKHNVKIGGSKNSNHVKGLAIDMKRTPTLEKFLLENLDNFDIWLEDPAYTENWLHVQIVPPASKQRIFKP